MTTVSGRQVRDGTLDRVDFTPEVQTVIAPGWRDITAPVAVRGSGSASPTWAQISGSVFWAYQFAIGREFFSDFHINHDYLPGGAIHLHVHWLCAGTSTQPVRWQIDYAIAKGHQQGADSVFPLASPTTVTLTQAPTGTALEHMVAEMPLSVPTGRLEPDTIIKARFLRVTNGGTDNPNDIFGMMADCHYQCDRMATPQKAPDFYAEP